MPGWIYHQPGIIIFSLIWHHQAGNFGVIEALPALSFYQAAPYIMGKHTEALAFLELLFKTKKPDEFILIWNKQGNEKKSPKISNWFQSTTDAARYALEQAKQPGHDLYVGAGLTQKKLGPHRRAKIEHVSGIGALWIDIDYQHPAHKKKNLPPTLAEAVALAHAGPLAPSSIIHSGHGIQAWWAFQNVWHLSSEEERASAVALAQGWQAYFKALALQHGWDVDSTFDLARVYRIPGTFNYKSEQPVPVKVLESGPVAALTPQQATEALQNAPALVTAPIPTQKPASGPQSASKPASSPRPKGNPDHPEWPVDFEVRPDADVPMMKFEALMGFDAKVKRTWERKRNDMQDQSASSYDYALANYAVMLGWANQDVVNLLISHRRKHGDDLKLDVAFNYYSRTLYNVRNTQRAHQAVNEVIRGEIEAGSAASAEIIERALGVRLMKIIKHKTTPPEYVLHLAGGEEISVGDAGGLINQDNFRKHIYHATGVLIAKMKNQMWEAVAKNFRLITVEMEAAEESTEMGSLKNWLQTYLHSQLRFTDNVRSQHDFALEGAPCVLSGQVHISLNHFRRFLDSHFNERITARALAVRLRRMSAEDKVVAIRTGETDSGVTSRNLWTLAPDEWVGEILNSKPRPAPGEEDQPRHEYAH
jgi:hypothetical protein